MSKSTMQSRFRGISAKKKIDLLRLESVQNEKFLRVTYFLFILDKKLKVDKKRIVFILQTCKVDYFNT
jgi:hypothetical protein